MPENPDDEDNPIKLPLENLLIEIIPAMDTVVINPNQETENMETHAPEKHKAPGQRW
ncbi:MAG: hypothetical protein ABI761_15735 [Saprospiraceae bacterium]